jgi:protein gp37
MTGKTTIEWANQPGYVGAVWNPTTGCTRVSAGCDNCYAFALHDKRFASNLGVAREHMGNVNESRLGAHLIAAARDAGVALPWPKQYDLPFSRVQLMEERIGVPLRVRRPTCYFVDSMADLFHEDVPTEFIARVFNVMGTATQHRFLILTKRPERMYAVARAYYDLTSQQPFANVWLGTSVEDQASADERIPHLLATPAAVRFLSCEPLLGPVDLTSALLNCEWCGHHQQGRCTKCSCEGIGLDYQPAIDWVIVGGESGARARPMDLAWARSLVAQCRAAGVAPFVKQMGSFPVDAFDGAWPVAIKEAHGRDMAEWPDDLRVREFP